MPKTRTKKEREKEETEKRLKERIIDTSK